MIISEFDIVRLKDGEEATILEVFKPIKGDVTVHYDVELSKSNDIKNISQDDISEIIYKVPNTHTKLYA